jgi:hypothetical protein
VREAGHLDLGPLRFSLQVDGVGSVVYSEPAYRAFYSAGASSAFAGPLCELPVAILSCAPAIPAGDPLWRGGKNWAVWEDGPDLVCCAGFHGRTGPQSGCRVARDLSRAELALGPAPGAEGIRESPLRYPLDQILSWGLLSRIGGALLHASVAVRDGVGWVFAGRSGAGKSTISGLCHSEGFRILNDDRVMVFRRAGEWKVAGTPWHGSGRFAEAAEVPLGGIYFLQKDARDFMESISASQARLSLLDVAAVPWFEDSWAPGALDGLARLVQDVELRRFHFTKTAAAVQALEKAQDHQRSGVCA